MKFASKLSIACIGTLASSIPSIHAEIIPGTQSDVTLALTASFTADLPNKLSGANTISSGKIQTTKFGNLEFLTALLNAGHIPDGKITGWKLVFVNSNPEHEDASPKNDMAFYLVKTGKQPVLIPQNILRISTDGITGNAETYTDAKKTVTDDWVSGKTAAYKGQVGIVGQNPDDSADFEMRGILSGSDTTGPVKIGNQSFFFFYTFAAAKISGICGSIVDSEGGDDLLMEGSITFAAAKPLDISMYPE